jgi:hypothetical protein
MSDAIDGARGVLSGLAGQPVRPPPSTSEVERWRARLAERPDDAEARAALWSCVHAHTLSARLAAAVDEDRVEVILADGSALSRGAAERAMVHKEEQGVYRPLRGPWLRARRSALDPIEWRARYDATVDAYGLASTSSASTARSFLRAFLAASAPLARPALEVLQASAGPIYDPASLARALDRPAGHHATDAVAVEAVRLTRPALPPDARPLQRRAGPRALRGHLVDDGEVIRVLWAESLRLGAQRALWRGVGRAYARAAEIPAAAGGLALTLQTSPMWRAVGASSTTATSLWRDAVAAQLIEARLAAAVVEAFAAAEVDPEATARDQLAMRRDAAWRAATQAVGIPPGDLVDDALMPCWPDGIVDLDATTAAAHQALELASAGRGVLSLRELGDEGLLLRQRGLMVVREMHRGADIAHTEADAVVAADAWRALLGEVG